jgi:hypothetical protein
MCDDETTPYGVLDRAALQAIGLTVVNFSQLEDLLSPAVNCLIVGTRPDDAAQLVLTRLQFRGLLDSFAGLYVHRFGTGEAKALKDFCGELDAVNEARNDLVHALWYPGEDSDQLTRYRTQLKRAGAMKSDHNVGEAAILDLAARIADLHARFASFVSEKVIDRIDDVVTRA